MATRFASGHKAFGFCDRCGQRYDLGELKEETVKLKRVNNRVCSSCFDPDHPQLQLGLYPVNDPQALRWSRPDTTYRVSGAYTDGFNAEGSRVIEWGWRPVGGGNRVVSGGTPNALIAVAFTGTATVS